MSDNLHLSPRAKALQHTVVNRSQAEIVAWLKDVRKVRDSTMVPVFFTPLSTTPEDAKTKEYKGQHIWMFAGDIATAVNEVGMYSTSSVQHRLVAMVSRFAAALTFDEVQAKIRRGSPLLEFPAGVLILAMDEPHRSDAIRHLAAIRRWTFYCVNRLRSDERHASCKKHNALGLFRWAETFNVAPYLAQRFDAALPLRVSTGLQELLVEDDLTISAMHASCGLPDLERIWTSTRGETAAMVAMAYDIEPDGADEGDKPVEAWSETEHEWSERDDTEEEEVDEEEGTPNHLL